MWSRWRRASATLARCASSSKDTSRRRKYCQKAVIADSRFSPSARRASSCFSTERASASLSPASVSRSVRSCWNSASWRLRSMVLALATKLRREVLQLAPAIAPESPQAEVHQRVGSPLRGAEQRLELVPLLLEPRVGPFLLLDAVAQRVQLVVEALQCLLQLGPVPEQLQQPLVFQRPERPRAGNLSTGHFSVRFMVRGGSQAGTGAKPWPRSAQYSSHLFSSMLLDQRLSWERGSFGCTRASPARAGPTAVTSASRASW